MCTSLGFLALVLVFLSAADTIANNNVCISPKGKSGICINLRTCPELLNLLLQKPLIQSTIKFLQQSQCGYENYDPKVCCESAYNKHQNSLRLSDVPDPDPVNVQFHPNIRLLDYQHCGPIQPNKLSIGGNRSLINEYAWMALIAYRKSRQPSSKPEFLCSGSVINKRYILTAAYCVTSLPSIQSGLELYGARVGEHDLSTEKDCIFESTEDEYCAEKYQDFLIESFQFHPQFSRTALVNDIALIRLDRDIDFRPDNAKPICLPIDPLAKFRYNRMIVAGWDIGKLNESLSVMWKTALRRFPQNQCVVMYKTKGLRITPKLMCFGEPGNDSYQGDLGGPLMGINIVNGKPCFVQYGIVSNGLMRFRQLNELPGVYTRVDQYLDWILNNIKD